MPKLKFIAKWSIDYQAQFQIPKGFLVLKYDEFYRENLGKTLLKLDGWQKSKLDKLKETQAVIDYEKDVLRDLDITLEFHYRKRTLDQNALMWSLYGIEANEQNGGQSGDRRQTVTKDELYHADLKEHGDQESITTTRRSVYYHLKNYQIVNSITVGDNTFSYQEFLKMDLEEAQLVTIEAIRGSSTFTTKEMAAWIDRIFNRLAYNGLSLENSSSIGKYWKNWKDSLNKNKIILHDEIMTQNEYKAKNPICEACGQFITDGQAELSHIKSVGMGGDRTKEPRKNYTSNWLCLHATPCHREYWHGEGVDEFKKRFTHLVYKINTALGRDYEPIEEEPEQKELFHEEKKLIDYEKACDGLDIF